MNKYIQLSTEVDNLINLKKNITKEEFNEAKNEMENMRGKLMICTKCGQDSQNHEDECDCKKAMYKLSFSYDKI